jgi:hypothetical protein
MWRSFIYRDDVTNHATKAKPDTQVLYSVKPKLEVFTFKLYLNYFVFLNLEIFFRKTLHNFIFRRWLFESASGFDIKLLCS